MTAIVQQPAQSSPTPPRPSLREYLAKALPSVREETTERMLHTARWRTVHPGEHIYRQGDPVPLTLIVEGYGAARRTTIGGKELVSGVAPAGRSVGLPARSPARTSELHQGADHGAGDASS